jgi:hypothetical protein
VKVHSDTDGALPLMPLAVHVVARGSLEDAVVRHHGHQGIDVVTVPSISERLEQLFQLSIWGRRQGGLYFFFSIRECTSLTIMSVSGDLPGVSIVMALSFVWSHWRLPAPPPKDASNAPHLPPVVRAPCFETT